MSPCFYQRASHFRYRCKLVKVCVHVRVRVLAYLSCRICHFPHQREIQLVLGGMDAACPGGIKQRPNIEELGSKKQSGGADGSGNSGFGSRYGVSF